MNQPPRQLDSPWPHRTAVLLVCATFGLICVGGLVTTTDAGMAFPNWLTIDGHFFLFYPLHRWLGGAWNQFIEHSHRLVATVVGLITIALALVLWRKDRRRWLTWLGVVAVIAVSFQGALGGLRVIENERTLAMVHGCVGPLFFGLTVAMAVFTSRRWRQAAVPQPSAGAGKLQRLALLTATLAYVQLVLGAWLRHLPAHASHETFKVALVFHLFMALAVSVHVLMLAWRALRLEDTLRALSVPAIGLAVLLVAQLFLGSGTWIAKWGWPNWFAGYAFAERHTILRGSSAETWITTGHMALGSLIFVTALLVSLRSLRLLRGVPRESAAPAPAASLSLEATR